jgi:hypothetical protein
MSTVPTRHRAGLTPKAWIACAWAALGLVPVSFAFATTTVEATISLLGYRPDATAPPWATLVAAAAATAMVLVPCITALVCGRRAILARDPHGRLPAMLGATVGIAWVVVTVAAQLGNLVGS